MFWFRLQAVNQHGLVLVKTGKLMGLLRLTHPTNLYPTFPRSEPRTGYVVDFAINWALLAISAKLFLIFFTGIPISNIEQGMQNDEIGIFFGIRYSLFCGSIFSFHNYRETLIFFFTKFINPPA